MTRFFKNVDRMVITRPAKEGLQVFHVQVADVLSYLCIIINYGMWSYGVNFILKKLLKETRCGVLSSLNTLVIK